MMTKQSPLSQSQLGMYLSTAYSNDTKYHIAYMCTFEAGFDTDTLVDAIEKVARCHPMITCRIELDDNGEPIMTLHDTDKPHITVESMTEKEFEALRPNLIEHIDMPGDKLFRFRIISTEAAVRIHILCHHVVSDGTSNHAIVNDLACALKGEELLPEAISGFEIAEKEAAERKTERFAEEREYYRNTFGDYDPDGADLYCDASSGTQRFAVGNFRLESTPDMLKNSVLAYAAMGVTIGAFTGKDDVIFSTITHGRDNHATDRTVTMMVRTLPVRCRMGDNITVDAYVRDLKRQIVTTRRKGLFSFADFSAMTGFDQKILFGYQGSFLDPRFSFSGMKAKTLNAGETGLPLSFMLIIEDGYIDVEVTWRADMYSEEMVRRFVKCFDKALQHVCDADLRQVPVASLPLQDDSDILHIKKFEKADTLDYDKSLPIEALIAHHAKESGDKTAVIFGDKRLSYHTIDEISSSIAKHLAESGIGKGSIVGVMIERSEWMVLLPLALMKIGAAYMPLDASFPEERLMFMIQDANVKEILTVDGLASEKLKSFTGRIIEATKIPINNVDTSTETVYPANPDSPFVVLYTSGSTGNPKGVTLTRANILNYCHDYISISSITAADRIPAYANFGFDAHMMDVYATLMAGATLYVLDDELRHDLDALHLFFEQNEITVAFLTTQIAWQMSSLYEFTSLRQLSGGGEKMPPMKPTPYTFVNIYGPTECSVAATCSVSHGDIDGSIIGKPLPGCEVRILDKHGRRTPFGVPGELVILGEGVGLGYLNREQLTAEKFVTIDGCKAYRTGDLARWTPDGDIQFIGRMDGMVKLRGLRIELGEIEAVANGHDAVHQFVAAVKNVAGNDCLVGYYSVKDGHNVEPDELTAFMSANLAEFMIPSAILKLDKFPVTPNGKIDRRALPLPEMNPIGEIVPPTTDLEKDVFEIAATILGHDAFGVTTNLLKVGLTSLLTMRLVAMIAKEKKIRISAKEAMANPTVRGIADTLSKAEKTDNDIIHKPKSTRKYYPITENQRGILIDWERNRDALQYNVAQAVKLTPGVDIERLNKALNATIAAHPALRARFVNRASDVMQQCVAQSDIEIPVIELESAPTRDNLRDMVKPFDLYGEPLYRFALLRYEGDMWLFVDFHHIVFDGVSAMVFFDTLVRAYSGESVREEEYSAFDRAVDEAELMQSSEYEDAERWFANMLDGFETTSYAHSSTPEPVMPGRMIDVTADIDAADIDKFCRDNAVTPSNCFLSCFMQVLHRLTRNDKVAITTVNNGRSDTRLIDNVGMFVKTLPVVSEMTAVKAKATTPAQMALSLQKQFSTVSGYDFYPFTDIVSKYDIRPEIMYVYEGGVSVDAAREPFADDRIELSLDTAKVPLTFLIFTPSSERFRLKLEFDASLYSIKDMQLLLDMITSAAQRLPECKTVSDATLLSAEQETLLAEIRDGEKGNVDFKSYHGAFEMQADLTPDTTALVATDKRMTYRELDAEANKIANALAKRGVERGDKVVVLLPRDSALISAIYGVMKSGAAYIPCDPDYPVERISLITEDSGAKTIITTADKLDSFAGKAVNIASLLAETNDSRPNIEISPDDAAYLIYTSGSTGRPKGVVIHHDAIANYLYGYRQLIYRPMGNDEPKVNMLIVTISFDASHVDLGTSLASGHTLVLANEEECKDVTLLAELMLRNGVDAFDATPSRLSAMLELPLFREAIAKCRLLNIGGEALQASLIAKLDDSGFRGAVVNEYGPTETTVGSNHAILKRGDAITVGRPFYNYSERILDAWGGELPIGATGELLIAGRSVGKGYHNLPEKTAESFISFNGERAYRTGDLARWTPEGDVEVLGRIDHQVKLRGLRIELGEIESVACSFAGVKAAVANVVKINNVDHLCLWYESDGVDTQPLKEHLQRHLTEYMVPDSLNPMPKIPLTPNGKIDRKNLPEPVLEALAEYVEPTEGLESKIATAYSSVLNLEKVGANDDFFKIGGTSINAIKVVAMLAVDGVRVNYKDLFAAKTPRALAALITDLHNDIPTNAPETKTDDAATDTESYSALLRANNLEAFNSGEHQTTGNILLTGATGFLGIHILHEILEKSDASVTCIVRGSASFSASSRLRTLLFYYFGNTYEDLWDERITITSGDITDSEAFAAIAPDNIDTVINCAASVKHFAADDRIVRTNTESVRNIADWCVKHGKRLVHISTVSVAGEIDLSRGEARILTEQSLDLGQDLTNQYVLSKYNAERIILDAMEADGLNAKIIRVGNISPRSDDGEFQANFQSNAFMGRLRAYLALGCIPYEHLGYGCEFSPVNELADAVLTLATSPADNIIFHPLNYHNVPLVDVITVMSQVLNRKIEFVENDAFVNRLNSIMAANGESVALLQPLLAYSSVDGNIAYNQSDSTFTNGILFRLGFRWSDTSDAYIRSFITAIAGLGYFDSATSDNTADA